MKALAYDLDYICEKMSDMSGLPIRICENGTVLKMFSVFQLDYDPFVLNMKEVLKIKDHVGYFMSDGSDFYGIINTDELQIVIGPSHEGFFSEQHIHDLAYALNVPHKDYAGFREAMKTIVPMPRESILQMMCTINHIFNGEKLSIHDFELNESVSFTDYNYGDELHEHDILRSLSLEKEILEAVKSGDAALAEQILKDAPTVRMQLLSGSPLRQSRNSFIIMCALVSRSAMEAGLDAEETVSMCNSKIRQCENAQSVQEVQALQNRMILSYAKKIGEMKKLTDGNRLKKDVYFYILAHISESVTVSDIAEHLYLSRSHLSTRFAKETGETLNHFIHHVKTEKAKELLADRSKSILQISDYLGYSSPSHFCRVFQEYCAMTPKDYRNNH